MKHRLKILIPLLSLAAIGAGAAEPVYVGYFRGPTMTNSSGLVMPAGLYSFTNITAVADSATRIGTLGFPSDNWQTTAFDGKTYFTFFRDVDTTNHRQGPGLYKYDSALSLISSNIDSGIVYTYTNWHGIGYCSPFYYGLYDGTAMSGPGLYRIVDPTDPESEAVRLFAPQTFDSNTWSDVDFDGTRWLFVRTSTAGNPGIYQYDPLTTNFTCISGTETYTKWDGIGVYVKPEPPPPSTNLPLLHKKIYVVLLGGQSNGLGWGYHQYLLESTNPQDFALSFPQTDVDMFNGFEGYLPLNTLLPLQSGAANSRVDPETPSKKYQYPALTNAPVSRFGPELSMGRTVRDLIHIPNSKVAVIKYAVGGTSLYAGWLPDGTTNSASDGPNYQKFQTTVRAGIAALQTQYPDYEIEIIGMGWVQGEQDAGSTQRTNYFANLTNLVADVRATFGANMVFALAKLSPNQSTNANYDIIREAQTAAAALPKVVATDTIGTNYLTADGFTEAWIHYLSPSLLQIGRDLGNAIVTASGLDVDNDGLPDAWENSYEPGAAGLGNSPDADYDHDGLTDLQEFQVGTDPTNPNDRLNLTNTQLRTRWPAKKDVRYQMRTSTNLTSWTDFGTPVLLRDSSSAVEIDLSQYLATNHSAFFRLQVL